MGGSDIYICILAPAGAKPSNQWDTKAKVDQQSALRECTVHWAENWQENV